MVTNKSEKGFGLIEVMVSLLVIVIGALGMAGLHSRSLQYNQIAYLHSQGIIIASDILDRIRLNQVVALTTDRYLVDSSAENPELCTETYYPDSCEVAVCTPEQLAEYDIKQWKFQIICQLPDATGEITYQTVDTGRLYEIKIQFQNDVGAINPGDIVLRGAI